MALNWGILGAGKIARDFILALKSLPDGENKVVAVGSSSEARAKIFAEENGIPKWYGSYEELTQDPTVQVVYVAGITSAHARSCKLALNNGKHVLCEKAFAMNLKEAEEVLDLAKEKKLFLMEAMWSRFLPPYIYLQEQLGKKAIGEVSVAMATFGLKMDAKPRVYDKSLGGSVLLDIGIYALTFADVVFNGEKPEKIVATGHLFDSGVDHTVSVTLLFSGRRIAQLIFTAGVALSNTASVTGSGGTVHLESPFHCTTKLTTPYGVKEFPLPELEHPSNFVNSAGLRYEIDATRKSILSGAIENDLMPHSTTIRIMQYMDEIRKQLGVEFDQDAL